MRFASGCRRLVPKLPFCPGLGMKRIAPHAGDPGHRHCFPAHLAFWAPPTFAFNFPPAWGINPSQTLVDLLPDHGVHRSHFGSRYKLGCCGNASLFFEFPCCARLRAAIMFAMFLRPPANNGKRKADSTQRSSQAVPHPSTNRALCRLPLEVRRDPVHSTRYGRQR